MIYCAGCFLGLPTGFEKKAIQIWMCSMSVSRQKSNLGDLIKNKRYFLFRHIYCLTFGNNFPVQSLKKETDENP